MSRPGWIYGPSGTIAQRAVPTEPPLARYLTVGGATVDLTEHPDDPEPATLATCTGCNAERTSTWYLAYFAAPLGKNYPQQPATARSDARNHAEKEARAWAQQHASTCRAMPRPEATT